MNRKLLTISIAAYNVDKTIANCIDSLLTDKEKLDLLDIIVVNDGSIDTTRKIVENYVNKYPESITLINKKNGGYGSTINTSIKYSKGTYFKLLDGDDTFDPDALSKYIDELKVLDVDMIITPYLECRRNGIKLCDNHRINEKKEYSLEKINDDAFVCMHEVTVKTSILREAKFVYDDKILYTDNEFVYNALKFSKTITKIGLTVYKYNVGLNGQSINKESIIKHYHDLLFICEKLLYDLKLLNNSNYDNYLLNKFMEYVTINSYYFCFIAGKKAKNFIRVFDIALLQNNKELYKNTNNHKLIKIARFFGFNLYCIYNHYANRIIK